MLTRCAVGHLHVPPPLHPAEGPRGRGGPHGVRTEVGSFFYYFAFSFLRVSNCILPQVCRQCLASFQEHTRFGVNSNPSRASAWRPSPQKGKRSVALRGGGASLSSGLRHGVTRKEKPGPKTLLGGALNPRTPGCARGAACGFHRRFLRRLGVRRSGDTEERRLLPVLGDSPRIGQGQAGSCEQPSACTPRAGVRLGPLGSDFHNVPEAFHPTTVSVSFRAFPRPRPGESCTSLSPRLGIRPSALIFRRSIKRISESFSSGAGEWEYRK